MIRGGCLCGGVRFEFPRAAGPFELCHCTRCRKVSGSAFMAGLGVRAGDFVLLSGRELLRSYEADLRDRPPAYRVTFCSRCGSPVPDPDSGADRLEVPAGLIDDDPQVRPDRHIYTEFKSAWFPITDSLPQLNRAEVAALRGGPPLASG